MSSPEVSVIVPNYNYGHYLAECLDSVLTQTTSNWEVIVVDDSSTDDSREIVQTYVDKYPDKFRLIPLAGGPSGTPRAVNAGVRAMRGRYFTWLSSDDRNRPTKLAELVKALEAHPEAGMAHTAYRIVDTNGQPTALTTPEGFPGTASFFRLLTGNIINGSTVLIPRTVLDEVGPLLETDEHVPDLWRIAEYLWWLEISFRFDIICLQEALHDFRIHSVNSDYNTATFGPALVRLSKRLFFRKHGLNNVVTALAGRSGASRAEVYSRIIRILSADTLPEDVALIADAMRGESAEVSDAVTAGLMRAQQGWASGVVAEFYLSRDCAVSENVLKSLDPESPHTETILLRALNRAKDEYRSGNFEKAASLLRTLVEPTSSITMLNTSTRYYLALSLELSGAQRDAFEEFERLLAMEPNHRSAQEGMERLRHGTTSPENQLAGCSGSR